MISAFKDRPWMVILAIAGIIDIVAAAQMIKLQSMEISALEMEGAYIEEAIPPLVPAPRPFIPEPKVLVAPTFPKAVDPDDFEYLGIEGWDSDFIHATWACDKEYNSTSATYPNISAVAAAKCDALDNRKHLWYKAYRRNKHRWETLKREQQITKY